MLTLSNILHRIQRIFPFLEQDLGPLTENQKQLVRVLELACLERFIPGIPFKVPGRPIANRRALARAFIAKAVLNLPDTRTLIDTIKGSSSLRRICGWESVGAIPHESTFSRAFDEFAGTEVPQRLHAALIESYRKPVLVGHISRDSTAIEAREKPVKKEKAPKKPKRVKGRPRKDEMRPPKEPTRLEMQASGMTLEEMLSELPRHCDVGAKKNSKGSLDYWTGYKLHVDWSDGEIPVSCLLSSASMHDSQAALPLMSITKTRVESLYQLMDAAYDSPIIKNAVTSLGQVPIIDINVRRKSGIVPMNAARKKRYNERSTAERGNSMLKDSFGGRSVRVRGARKVMSHLMFGIVALAATQIMRMLF